MQATGMATVGDWLAFYTAIGLTACYSQNLILHDVMESTCYFYCTILRITFTMHDVDDRSIDTRIRDVKNNLRHKKPLHVYV